MQIARKARYPWRFPIHRILVTLLFLPVAFYGYLLRQHRQSVMVPQTSSSEQRPTRRANHKVDSLLPPSDGTFNTVPIYYMDEPLPTASVNCVGNDWTMRSCEYSRLCFDVSTKQYVTNIDTPEVSIGGINPRWNAGHGFDRGLHKVKWKPRKVASIQSYYRMDKLMVPFHSMAGHNVGHLLWDDLLSLFGLLKLFGKLNDELLLIRHQLNETLYANCDIRRNKRQGCQENFGRFLDLFGVQPKTFFASNRVQLLVDNIESSRSSSFVCGPAVAGLGMLTDHGWRDHGWDFVPIPSDQLTVPHNLGRGRMFYEFSRYLIEHSNQQQPSPAPKSFQVTFSIHSSRDEWRQLDFSKQIEALQSLEVPTKSHSMRDHNLLEQIEIAAQSSVFVTAAGGGSMTATFLPRGSVLIVFFNSDKGLDFETLSTNGKPARLDWDLLNAASHLTVHWLPIEGMDDSSYLDLFAKLIRHEQGRFERRSSAD